MSKFLNRKFLNKIAVTYCVLVFIYCIAQNFKALMFLIFGAKIF